MPAKGKKLRKSLGLFFAILFLGLTTAGAEANLLLNPSFETKYANWSYSNVDWWTGWVAKDGNVSIDLSACSAGWVSQAFDTTIGERYEVTFWLAGNPQGPPTVKTMHVSAGNVSDLEYTFDTTGHNTSNMGWTEESFYFKALATSTTLKFESLNNTCYGPAIDLVSVDPSPAPAPLSASVGFFGTGLLGLLLSGWKFRQP